MTNFNWQQICCGNFDYAELELRSGDWLRIIKPFLGGYKVTRYGKDKLLKEAEQEMSLEDFENLMKLES